MVPDVSVDHSSRVSIFQLLDLVCVVFLATCGIYRVVAYLRSV